MPAGRRASWSPEEDGKLKAYIKRYGIWNWSQMPEAAGTCMQYLFWCAILHASACEYSLTSA